MHLDSKTSKILLRQHKTIAVAESCTGGLLCDSLTNIPGASSFFWLGIIAYDNQAKVKLLKVPSSVIKKHGAVSLEVAKLMAQNIRKILKTDLGVGITGIAGPLGGTAAKPVGRVYIAVANAKSTVAQKFQFKGSRLSIKNQAAQQAMRQLMSLCVPS
jgi:PncC family amidohydrolase